MVKEFNTVPTDNVTPLDILPGPLKNLRETATALLQKLLGRMFDNADDALFELAHKTSSGVDQTMYFDSMREVRIQRQGMEATFVKQFREGFRKLYQPEHEDTGSDPAGADLAGLSLMQNEELEEVVAVRGMVSKVAGQKGEVLSALTQRVAHLLPTRKVTDGNNPLGPQRLCEAFGKACELLALDIRARLVVYKLFERYVLGDIDALYDEANRVLIDGGVLPQLGGAKRIRKSSTTVGSSPRPQEPQRSPAQSNDSAGDAELFEVLRGLLSDSGVTGKGSGLPVEQGPVIGRQDLLQMLSTLQFQNRQLDTAADMPPREFDLQGAMYDQIQRFAAYNEARSIGRVDDDVINLVSMLFEFILDDHNLSPPMKALLARLQIPMLKVALLDREFFSRGGHPARKLLNELASAALGWSETTDLTRDKLYAKISDTVARVLNDFDDDMTLFQQLLDEFTAFVEQEKRRARLIEQRTKDAEEGLGRTQQARAVIAEVLNHKVLDKQLPAVVAELLREGWSHYLFLIHVKEGVESSQWQAALETVDDLIWSVQPAPDKTHSNELLKQIPELLQRLRKGLTEASFSKARMRSLFKELESIHLQCLQAPSRRPAATAPPADHPEQPRAQQADAVSPTTQPEPLMAASDNAPQLSGDSSAEDQDEYLARVDALGSGTWVELVIGDKKQRAKLVAVIRSTGKYIFVNRVGIKVAEKTRALLAQELREQKVSILDDSLLFDRALESVIGNLRQLKA